MSSSAALTASETSRRVGAGLLVDGDEGGRHAVELAVDDVLPQPDLDPGDVLEVDDGAPPPGRRAG